MPRTATDAECDLKAKHRTMWGLGDYETVAVDLIPSLGEVLVEASGITAGQRVLDVAAGAGNVSIPAARTGADVTASDLCPDLLARGAAAAAHERLSITWDEADAEALPYDEASYDAVLSCVGVMFAPHHQQAADELARVVRPGGTIGLISWTPEGFLGRLLGTMKPFVPAPGVEPPTLWGDLSHVEALFGDRIGDLRAERRPLAVTTFGSGAHFRGYFKANYGPTIVAYRALADDPNAVAELDAALGDLGDSALEDGTMAWEYLLVVATRT